MMTRLLLVAQAETDATRSARFPLDEPVSPKGRIAAERLCGRLPRPARVFLSPARAAHETLAIMTGETWARETWTRETWAGETWAGEARVDPALADLDCGRWRGKSLETIAERDPDGLAAWRLDPFYAGHGGLSIEALRQRVALWLDSRLSEPGLGLAVTHTAVMRCALLTVIDAPSVGFWTIDIPPLAKLELGSDGRRWTLRGLTRDAP